MQDTEIEQAPAIKYAYKQGDIVAYSLNTPVGCLEGTGRIVGVAVNHIPIMGCIYMVEDPENFPNSVYQYTIIPMQESALEFLYHIPEEYIVCILEGDAYGYEVEHFGNDYKAAKAELEFHRLNSPNHVYATARILNQSKIKE